MKPGTTMKMNLEEFGKRAAEWALDELEYKGLTIRQWADKITSGEYEKVSEGQWVIGADGHYHCSRCQKLAFIDRFEDPLLSDYCPKCGARMGVSK